ncbi:MAG: serine hydrolase [Betaproteobacteria bacterium]|nr:serine hydrolase [Betaproteobacteria bacterium]
MRMYWSAFRDSPVRQRARRPARTVGFLAVGAILAVVVAVSAPGWLRPASGAGGPSAARQPAAPVPPSRTAQAVTVPVVPPSLTPVPETWSGAAPAPAPAAPVAHAAAVSSHAAQPALAGVSGAMGKSQSPQASMPTQQLAAVPEAVFPPPKGKSLFDPWLLHLRSAEAIVVNERRGEMIYGKNVDMPRPIASISKLMMAMVVLDAHLPMNQLITVTSQDVDRLRWSASRLNVGTTLTRRALLRLALMASENRAAYALARTYPGGEQACVAAMNRKARALGMMNTTFLDPTGLHSQNQSTPEDLALMVQAAYRYPLIRQFTTTAEYTEDVHGDRRPVLFRNTDLFVRTRNRFWHIGLSKTGFINEAGQCLVMRAKIARTPYIIVLLDSWGPFARFSDANAVRSWIENARAGQLARRRGRANDA